MLADLVEHINSFMEQLGVSHLYLSPPAESRAVLDHVSIDTGLRVRLIDGVFVVHTVLGGSPADEAGFVEGDIVESINDAAVQYVSDVSQSGVYKVKRGEKKLTISVEGVSFQEDLRPQIFELTNSTVVLSMPSFEGHFQDSPLFEQTAWLQIVRDLRDYRHIIIDLRGNIGGNFTAMLRAASPFFCPARYIGSIRQPRRTSLANTSVQFPDSLEDELQLETLEKYAKIDLITFSGYGCLRAAVTVLVDSETASVSEIFADAFRFRPRSRIWGTPTSGSVLVAKRSEMLSFGHGFVLNIPVASYFTEDGKDLEVTGVQPEKILFYELGDALNGIDTWYKEAVETSFK